MGKSKINKVYNYLCACEGQQEDMYLKHLSKLLSNHPQYVVNFNNILGPAQNLSKKKQIKYDKACLFDYDFDKSKFESNYRYCVDNSSERLRVHHAYSNVCFDLWLCLHKKYTTKAVSQANGYVSDVREVYNLDKNADIKSIDIMKKILSQIDLNDVRTAISNAEKLKNAKLDSDRIFLSGKNVWYFNQPDFSIHIFLKEIVKNYDKYN